MPGAPLKSKPSRSIWVWSNWSKPCSPPVSEPRSRRRTSTPLFSRLFQTVRSSGGMEPTASARSTGRPARASSTAGAAPPNRRKGTVARKWGGCQQTMYVLLTTGLLTLRCG